MEDGLSFQFLLLVGMFLQVAEKQGRYLAKVLNDKMSGPFQFKSMGMLAYIGGYSGLTDTPDAKLKGMHHMFRKGLCGTRCCRGGPYSRGNNTSISGFLESE